MHVKTNPDFEFTLKIGHTEDYIKRQLDNVLSAIEVSHPKLYTKEMAETHKYIKLALPHG